MLSIDLRGMSALVTGGVNGIGAACVRALAAAGARVVSVDLADTKPEGASAHFAGDVTDPALRAKAVAELGEGRAVLVNNAAIQYERRLGETTSAEARQLFEVNVQAAIDTTVAFADGRPAGSSVVNMASVLGVTGDPLRAVYSATKGAMVNLTRTMALEYAGRIRVNAVLPGAVRTSLTTRVWEATGDAAAAERRNQAVYPVGRIGEPEDIGPAVAFLASPLAAFVNGVILPIDGGLLAANAGWALDRV